ncbi:MAG: DUF2218 domain-containing protein [Rhodobacteraceae bacterium]|nr:DUF2218 domain-containing protein [Paracoccaceae bacterium]
MPISTASIATPHGSRYLQQLCKHWSHRYAVTFDPAQGMIDFGGGKSARLSADAAMLRVQVTCPDPAALSGLFDVVESHILRFAFREELQFDWQVDLTV